MSATDTSTSGKGYLSVRLKPAMRKQLDELAERNESTPSREVRIAIRKHLEQENGK